MALLLAFLVRLPTPGVGPGEPVGVERQAEPRGTSSLGVMHEPMRIMYKCMYNTSAGAGHAYMSAATAAVARMRVRGKAEGCSEKERGRCKKAEGCCE